MSTPFVDYYKSLGLYIIATIADVQRAYDLAFLQISPQEARLPQEKNPSFA
jgi:hypothetical protein